MTATNRQTGVPGVPFGDAGDALTRLAAVISELRTHCLWTAALTHGSLVKYLVEESYELVDVVEAPGPLDAGELKGELGDILYQVVLHSLLQSEAGGFTLADVADHLREKLVHRNPHVFHADGSLQDTFPDSIAEIERSYEAAKSAEAAVPTGAFDSLPASLPALALAAKTLDRVEGRSPAPVGRDRREGARRDGAGRPQTEDELGELLFDVVRGARAQGLDAERALRTAVRRFQER